MRPPATLPTSQSRSALVDTIQQLQQREHLFDTALQRAEQQVLDELEVSAEGERLSQLYAEYIQQHNGSSPLPRDEWVANCTFA